MVAAAGGSGGGGAAVAVCRGASATHQSIPPHQQPQTQHQRARISNAQLLGAQGLEGAGGAPGGEATPLRSGSSGRAPNSAFPTSGSSGGSAHKSSAALAAHQAAAYYASQRRSFALLEEESVRAMAGEGGNHGSAQQQQLLLLPVPPPLLAIQRARSSSFGVATGAHSGPGLQGSPGGSGHASAGRAQAQAQGAPTPGAVKWSRSQGDVLSGEGSSLHSLGPGLRKPLQGPTSPFVRPGESRSSAQAMPVPTPAIPLRRQASSEIEAVLPTCASPPVGKQSLSRRMMLKQSSAAAAASSAAAAATAAAAMGGGGSMAGVVGGGADVEYGTLVIGCSF